ncbi:S8 family serine peptidase [Virgibacillus siamensis]|uniref:S8 family serine peptidase n=1 Tax=Virgibacillus siamensis TaxID=480071 RepID=UPI000986FA69|nr:S8 family serine peptidase [Virgibacillus siamensis]
MRKRRFTVLSIVLSVILVLSTMIPSTQFANAANNKSKDAADILNNLTEKERNQLNKLEADPNFTIQPGINIESTDPVNVVVEFKQEPAKVEMAKAKLKRQRTSVTLSKAEEKVESSHKKFNDVISQLKKRKSVSAQEIAVTQEYRSAFNGVAMTLPGNKIKTLIDSGLVERIWKDKSVQLELPESNQKKIEPKMADSIPQIGVDKLHEEGIKGEGINVGVIDTGIDYNHPDLKKAYEGYKKTKGEDPSQVNPDSVKGWDYVGNDADPMETTYKEWQKSGKPEFDYRGSSYYTSHGTHVSGTIAGQKDNAVDYAVKGVAPEADLYSYRVLGPYGSGKISWILAGIDKAVKDKMDVINLSLGSSAKDPLSPTSVAVNNAMLSGVVTVVAAGNAGPGEKTLGSPGTSAMSITVGASDVSQTIPTFTASAGDIKFNDVKLLGKNFKADLKKYEDQAYPVVFAGLGTPADFADKNLEGKIALIERGSITFDEKIKNATNAGAEAVIVYNNIDGQIPYYLGENTAYIPAFRISKEDGQALKAAITDGAAFTFQELGNTKTVGDHLADFSSRGPVSHTYDIKPDVVAPGVAIYSTAPFYINDAANGTYETAYQRMNGTSMATPHVAGTAALILQENPKYTPFDVKTALMNTSVDLQEDYSVYEVGSGRINAYDAVHAKTSISVQDKTEMMDEDELINMDNPTGSLSFGSHFLDGEGKIKESQSIVIANQSSADNQYNLNVEFLSADGDRQDAETNDVSLELKQTVTIPSGDNKEITPVISVPQTAAVGTYEGYVHVVNADNPEEAYQIPFAIRITEKGINSMELFRHAVPNEWTFHSFLVPFIGLEFKLNSKMETIDMIVADADTDEPIGYLGSLNAKEMPVDTTLYVVRAFMGNVFLFTGDPSDPIADELTKLDEGAYKIKMIASDSNGNQYTADEIVAVDNTPAEMTFDDYNPGIYEVDESMYTDEDGYHALWVHTNVYDSTIDLLNSYGLDYDQSENIVAYYQNSPFPGRLPVSADGNMKFGVLPEEVENGPVKLRLMPVDLATNARLIDQIPYVFVKKGTAYGEVVNNQKEVKLGDEITLTLKLDNVKKLVSGEFKLNYMKDLYEFKGVKLSDELAQYAKEHNVEINTTEPEISDDLFAKTVKVGAAFDKQDFEGFSGDINFIDVTFEVIGDAYYGEKAQLIHTVQEFTYQSGNKDEVKSIPVFAQDEYNFISKHSTVNGYINAEAFLHEAGFPLNLDYEEIGVKISAKDSKGNIYKGAFTNGSRFEIKGLPVSKDPYKIILDAPGHLNSSSKIQVSKKVDGDLRGDSVRVDLPLNYAGDVNDDGLIDIMDVMRVVAHYGKSIPSKADLNKDGTVNETDIRYIEKNFLKVGKEAKAGKEPREKLGNKGLNDFLQAIGLEPAK